MIISLNIKKEITYYKIFEVVKIVFTKLNSNTQNTKGRPHKYSDEQIVCCMLYGVKNSIFSLRELAYIIIPLVFNLTTANVYDNQLSDLLYEAKIYNL